MSVDTLDYTPPDPSRLSRLRPLMTREPQSLTAGSAEITHGPYIRLPSRWSPAPIPDDPPRLNLLAVIYKSFLEEMNPPPWSQLGLFVSALWPKQANHLMALVPDPELNKDWLQSLGNLPRAYLEPLRGCSTPVELCDALLTDNKYDTRSSVLMLGTRIKGEAYGAALDLIQQLMHLGVPETLLLDKGLDQHFLIYAHMDLGLPLPKNFNRELLWTHLSALVDLDRTNNFASSHSPKFLAARRAGEPHDPDGIVPFLQNCLVELQSGKPPHELNIPPLVHDLEDREVHEVTIDSTYRITRYGCNRRVFPVPPILDSDSEQQHRIDDSFRVYWAVFDFLMCHVRSLAGYNIVLQVRTNNFPAVCKLSSRRAENQAQGGPPSNLRAIIRTILAHFKVELRAAWVPFSEVKFEDEEKSMLDDDSMQTPVWDWVVYKWLRVGQNVKDLFASGVFGFPRE